MINRGIHFLVFFSTLGSGLIAGLFFAFSICVMTTLSRLPSAQGIAAMQSINVTILNPLFGFVFFGTALASAILAFISFFRLGESGSVALLAGSLLYLVGAFLVTVVFNVPLNDLLAAANPETGGSVWSHYLAVWTPWNHVRTICSLASLAFFIIAFRQLS